jgi:hypothetical protein
MAREGEWASAAAWADWAKNKGEFKIRFDFQISMDFWNLARLWEVLKGDLEGIWIWGFWLNSSRLLKDL